MERPLHPLVAKLVEIQRERGLSGRETARRLGIREPTWSRLARGKMHPNIDLVSQAAGAFPEIRFFLVEVLLISQSDSPEEQSLEVAV